MEAKIQIFLTLAVALWPWLWPSDESKGLPPDREEP